MKGRLSVMWAEVRSRFHRRPVEPLPTEPSEAVTTAVAIHRHAAEAVCSEFRGFVQHLREEADRTHPRGEGGG